MKLYIKIFILIISTSFLHSCKEIIDVDTPSAVTKLVIEADLTFTKGKDNNKQTITLTETGTLNSKESIPAKGANVSISLEDGPVIQFEETKSGVYTTENFVAKLGYEYVLDIEYNNEKYQSKQEFIAVSEIKEVGQSIEFGNFIDEPEVIWTWDDPVGIDNFYFFEVEYNIDSLDEIQRENWSWDDSFEDGNELYDFFESDQLKKGVEIKISVSGITKQYSTFLQLISNQENQAPGPFASTPVNVKGNVLNISKSENYPYGYFILREKDEVVYVFE